MALTGNSFFRLFRKLRMGGDGVSVRTLTGNLSLTVLEEQLCDYDPGGASRNVTIHVDDNVVGNWRAFYNSADADGENLVIKNSAGTTIVTIGRGETGVVVYGGSTPAWKKLLLTDGTSDVFSTANTWSAEQTFGAGIALLDSDNITLGTGDDDTIGHDGTNTTWTHAVGDLIIDNTDVDDQIILRVGTDTTATGIEFRNNSDVVMFSVVPASASTGTALVAGTLDHNGTLDQDAALTATGDVANIAGTMSHATQVAEGLDVSIAQITNARTSGSISAIKASVTSLTGSTAGTDHYAYEAAVTVGEATADHYALKVGAGFDGVIDSSSAATGETVWVLPDAVASAFLLEDSAGNDFLLIDTVAADGMTFGNATTNPVYTFLGSGAVSLAGGGLVTIPTGKLACDDFVKVTCTVPNSAAGVNTVLATFDVFRLDGTTAVASARQIMIRCGSTQYDPAPNVEASVTFSLATAGAIIASGSGWCLAETDATGNFDCTITNTDDETVYFWAETASKVSVTAEGCVVVSSNADSAQWTA